MRLLFLYCGKLFLFFSLYGLFSIYVTAAQNTTIPATNYFTRAFLLSNIKLADYSTQHNNTSKEASLQTNSFSCSNKLPRRNHPAAKSESFHSKWQDYTQASARHDKIKHNVTTTQNKKNRKNNVLKKIARAMLQGREIIRTEENSDAPLKKMSKRQWRKQGRPDIYPAKTTSPHTEIETKNHSNTLAESSFSTSPFLGKDQISGITEAQDHPHSKVKKQTKKQKRVQTAEAHENSTLYEKRSRRCQPPPVFSGDIQDTPTPHVLSFCPKWVNELIRITAVKSEDLDTFLTQVNSRNWSHSIFRSAYTYDLLLHAYLNQALDEATFMDVQDYIQILSTFGDFRGLPDEMTPARGHNVTRLEAFAADEMLEEFQRHIKISAGEYDLEKLRNAAGASQPEVTVVKLNNDSYNKLIAKIGIRETSDHYQQLMSWLATIDLILKFPGLIYIDFNRKLLVLPSISFFNFSRQWRYSQTSEHIKITPLFCPMDFDELALMRNTGRHPLALYHPSLPSLIFPHKAFFSAMSSRHDEYHILRIDSIPPLYREMALIQDLIQEDFVSSIKHASKSSLLSSFSEEFQQKLTIFYQHIADELDAYCEASPELVHRNILCDSTKIAGVKTICHEGYMDKHSEDLTTLAVECHEKSTRYLVDQDFKTFSVTHNDNYAFLVQLVRGWRKGRDFEFYHHDFVAILYLRLSYTFYRWDQACLFTFYEKHTPLQKRVVDFHQYHAAMSIPHREVIEHLLYAHRIWRKLWPLPEDE